MGFDLGKFSVAAANGIVVVGVFLLMFSQVDISRAVAAVSRLSVPVLLVAAVAYACIHLVNAGRYYLMGKVAGVGFQDYLRGHWSAMALSDVTPGRVGYAYFAIAMRGRGVAGTQSARMLGMNLALDFLVRAVSLVILSVVVAPNLFGGNMLVGICFAAVTLVAVAALAVPSRHVAALVSRVPFAGARLGAAYAAAHSSKLGVRAIASSLAGSLVGSVLRGLEWLAIFWAVTGVALTPWNLLLFSAFVAVITGVSFLPISIAGLGVQEGIGASAFSLAFGVVFSEAAAAILACRAIELAVDALGLLWVRGKPAKNKE